MHFFKNYNWHFGKKNFNGIVLELWMRENLILILFLSKIGSIELFYEEFELIESWDVFVVIVNLACKRNRGEFGKSKEREMEKSWEKTVVKRREKIVSSFWYSRLWKLG